MNTFTSSLRRGIRKLWGISVAHLGNVEISVMLSYTQVPLIYTAVGNIRNYSKALYKNEIDVLNWFGSHCLVRNELSLEITFLSKCQ